MPDPSQTAALAALEQFRKVGAVAAMQQTQRFTGVVFQGGTLVSIEDFFVIQDADGWFDRVTQDPRAFTYAAYFDKQSPTWPSPLEEAVGTVTALS